MAVNRSVEVVTSSYQDSELKDKAHYQDFLDIPNLVLLGEPGSGKSHTFAQFTKLEDAELFEARVFPNDADSDITDKCVYIDGLDESRSTAGSSSTIEKIVSAIKDYSPKKIRISCRAQDWLGETDLIHFKRKFEKTGGYAVLQLCELTTNEQKEMLASLGEERSEKFIESAYDHSVKSFLSNPQTLKMLHEVVRINNSWPETKSELFNQATTLLLTEHNQTVSLLQTRSSSIDELRSTAGALYSLLLISGINGFCLHRAVSDIDYPCYQDIAFIKSNVALEVLKSKAFNKVSSEKVSSTHRTIAEYLSAKWIAKSITNGLPLIRILSLIGFENRPSIELRGLYAWLPEFLPNHALDLIRNDPATMISGGDVSSLPVSILQTAIEEISNQSQNNPWYLDWHSGAGKFSRQEFIPTFIDILSDDKNSTQVHSFILESIANGPIIKSSDLCRTLFDMLFNENEIYTLRSSASRAIANIYPEEANTLLCRVRTDFLEKGKECRLSSEIISKTYPLCGNPKDVALLFQNYRYGLGVQRNLLGEISDITSKIDSLHSADILHEIICLDESEKQSKEGKHRGYEVAEIMDSLTSNYLDTCEVDPAFLWKISDFVIKKQHNYNFEYYKSLPLKLKDNRELLLALILQAIKRQKIDNTKNLQYYILRSIIRLFETEEVYKSLKITLSKNNLDDFSKREVLKTALWYIWQLKEPSSLEFSELNKLVKGNSNFEEIINQSRSWVIDPKEQTFRLKDFKNKEKILKEKSVRKNEFDRDIEIIKSGDSKWWLVFLSYTYYGKYRSTSKAPIRGHRLDKELGFDRSKIAKKSLVEFSRKETTIDKFNEEYNEIPSSNYYEYWYAIIAGLELDYENTGTTLQWPDGTVEMAIILAFRFDIYDINENGSRTHTRNHTWLDSLYRERNEESIKALMTLVMKNLAIEHQNSHLDVFISNDIFSDVKHKMLKAILDSRLDICSTKLKIILKTLLSSKGNDEYLINLLGENHFDSNIMSCINFFLNDNLEPSFNKESIWIIIEFINNNFYSQKRINLDNLSTKKIVTLILFLSEEFEFVEDPHDRNNKDSDSTIFINQCLNRLSTRTSVDDIAALESLIKANESDAYQAQVKYSIHNQDILRRQRSYKKPNFQQTLNTLNNHKPVNHQDLLALTIDHLDSLEIELRNDNFNGYKYFWNEKQHKVTDPKPEDAARDVLIDQLRSKLTGLGISVEPESLMAKSKRVDVILSIDDMKLPIEIKRDYHSDVWTACEDQLKALYTILPQADGYGVFLVFWYGESRGKKNSITCPPTHISKKRPTTAKEMQKMLEALITSNNQHCIKVKVFDVSP